MSRASLVFMRYVSNQPRDPCACRRFSPCLREVWIIVIHRYSQFYTCVYYSAYHECNFMNTVGLSRQYRFIEALKNIHQEDIMKRDYFLFLSTFLPSESLTYLNPARVSTTNYLWGYLYHSPLIGFDRCGHIQGE